MELKEFIKQTLVQITQGVKEAQIDLKETGCLINPKGIGNKTPYVQLDSNQEFRNIQQLKITAVLTISEKEGSEKGIGIAKVISAGINSQSHSANQQMNSIEFEIPIALPIMEANESK